MTLQDKIEASIALLRKSEPLALEMNENGFYLAFSGGKDSLCLYHVAKMAGVKFEAHYNVTTLDPPELVYFIRDHYPDVKFVYPKQNFWQMCLKKIQVTAYYAPTVLLCGIKRNIGRWPR